MSEGPAVKKAKYDDVPEHLSDLSEEAKKALVAVDEIQSEIDGINEKASDEILKIEQKYSLARKPHYERRSNVIKQIPRFWAQTLLNHPNISLIIDDGDLDLVNAITNIEVEDSDNIKQGWKIKFFFGPNEYFENDKIEKEYFLDDNATSTVSPIKWKAGKQVSSASGDEENMNFRQWLVTTLEGDNADEIAELIKDDIWPNPVQYFINPNIDGDEDDFGDEDADDEEEVDDPENSDEN